MAMLLVLAGVGCVIAYFYAADDLGDKRFLVFVAGLVLAGAGAGMMGSSDCDTGWNGRGSYSSC